MGDQQLIVPLRAILGLSSHGMMTWIIVVVRPPVSA